MTNTRDGLPEPCEASVGTGSAVVRVGLALLALGLLDIAIGLSLGPLRAAGLAPPIGAPMLAGLALVARSGRYRRVVRAAMICVLTLWPFVILRQWWDVPNEFVADLVIATPVAAASAGVAVLLTPLALLSAILILASVPPASSDRVGGPRPAEVAAWKPVVAAAALALATWTVSVAYRHYDDDQRAAAELHALGVVRARFELAEHTFVRRMSTSRLDDRLVHEASVVTSDPKGYAVIDHAWSTSLDWLPDGPLDPPGGRPTAEQVESTALACGLERWARHRSKAPDTDTLETRHEALDFTPSGRASDEARRRFLSTFHRWDADELTDAAREFDLAQLEPIFESVVLDGMPMSRSNLADTATLKVTLGWQLSEGEGVDAEAAAALRRAMIDTFGTWNLDEDERRSLGEQNLLDIMLGLSYRDELRKAPDEPALRNLAAAVGRVMQWEEGFGWPFSRFGPDDVVVHATRASIDARPRPPPNDPDGLVADSVFLPERPHLMARHYCADGRLLIEWGESYSPDTLAGHWQLEPGSTPELLRVRESIAGGDDVKSYELLPDRDYASSRGGVRVGFVRDRIMACAPARAPDASPCDAVPAWGER